MSTNPTSQENAEPVVILKRQTENAFALKFHEAELLILPAQGGDNFTPDEQHALQLIVLAVNSHASDQRRIKELEEALGRMLYLDERTQKDAGFTHGPSGRDIVESARSLLSQGATK